MMRLLRTLLFVVLLVSVYSCTPSKIKYNYSYLNTDMQKFFVLEENIALKNRWEGFEFLEETTISNSCGVAPSFSHIPDTDCLDQILVADINSDGYLDIFLGSNLTENLSAQFNYHPYYYIYLNDGDGTMSFAIRLDRSGPEDLMTDIADLVPNNDNPILDLVGANFNGAATVWYAKEDSTANSLDYNAKRSFSIARHGGDSFAFDYDGDGLKDVISFGSGSGASILVNLYKGTIEGIMSSSITLFTGTYSDSTAQHRTINPIDDLNGDGYIDFGLMGSSIYFILLSSGYQQYRLIDNNDVFRYIAAPTKIFKDKASGRYILSILAYNHVTGKYNEYNEIPILQDGTMRSTDKKRHYNIFQADFGVFEDINYDGLVDIVYLNNGVLSYMTQHASGFSGPVNIRNTGRRTNTSSGETSFQRIAVADFNNDGLKDIAVIMRGADGANDSYLQIYLAK